MARRNRKKKTCRSKRGEHREERVTGTTASRAADSQTDRTPSTGGGSGSRLPRVLLAALSSVGALLARGVRGLGRAAGGVEWAAIGIALAGAASWTAQALWHITKSTGRLSLRAARGLIALLVGIDWRGVGRALISASIRAFDLLFAGIRRIPDLLVATFRGIYVLIRAVAIVGLTLLFTTLFVGAVLLGSGHVASSQDQRSFDADQRQAILAQKSPATADPSRSPADSLLGGRSTEPVGRTRSSRAPAMRTETSPLPRPNSKSVTTTDRRTGPREVPAASSADPRSLLTPTSGPLPEASTTVNAIGPRPASCSSSTRVRGPLLHPAKIPDQGEGFARIFPHRNLAYGTDELVGAIERAAVGVFDPALPPLMVGNLSGPRGDQAGADPFHPARYARGQGAGRAGDLLFFVTDALGRPVPAAETNIGFDTGGSSVAGVRRLYLDDDSDLIPEGCHLSRRRDGMIEAACPVPAGTWRIDFERTWHLVRALLTDPVIGAIDEGAGLSRPDGDGIRFIFVDEAIKRGILSAAREAGESEGMVQIAGILLHDPSNSSAFNRFMRLDLWCTEEDRRGCRCEDGSERWNRWRAQATIEPPSAAPAPRVAAASGL